MVMVRFLLSNNIAGFAAAATAALIGLVSLPDKTRINGTFNGCEMGRTYELLDGRTLECRSYRYHYAYAPEVIVLDSTTVVIDGDEYSVSIR
jgi:hypothetical protein